MHATDGRFIVSPTDLANFLACRHKTSLDLLTATGRLSTPTWKDPFAEILRQRGEEHERRYIDRLRAEGLEVVDLAAEARDTRVAATRAAMRAGADVIVQAALASGEWLGYADVLRKVASPSALGAWSYEAVDTKLSRETRGGTILQLCVYSDLLGEIQGRPPGQFHVITPAGHEPYRVDDFAAFYRQTRAAFASFVGTQRPATEAHTYPEPVAHCDVCRWGSRCHQQRRADDHLTFVAGLGRAHAAELKGQRITTMAGLAVLPLIPFKPNRGSRDTYERLREQARLQVDRRESGRLAFDLLPLAKDLGLMQLPEPRPGDVFLDLEGDPFGRPGQAAEAGATAREYLFGLGRVAADGTLDYRARWAFSDDDERRAFEAVMDEIVAAMDADPAMHVYHYAPYEPSAFKRLAGRYASREADLDRVLRGGRFVDLYAIVRQSLRAAVEHYSIKDLEPFYGFSRTLALETAGDQRRLVEVALETHDHTLVTAEVRDAVERYNADDVWSTRELQRWLESLRQQRVDAGDEIPRPPLEPDAPSDEVTARQARIIALRARLLEGVPPDRCDRTGDAQARFLLAYLLDWHAREDKVVWWEYFRLLELSDEDLIDERAAVSGLEFVDRVDVVRHKTTGQATGSVIDRYRFPPQECDLRRGDELTTRDQKKLGAVVALDRAAGTIDLRKGPSVADEHPVSAFSHERISPEIPAGALFRLGERMADGGFEAAGRSAADLLRGVTGTQGRVRPAREDESATDYAVRVVGALGDATLPIQGPPGSGKTFTGARMIGELVRQGKRVGVAATSHKVIRNLLQAVAGEAGTPPVRLGHRVKDVDPSTVGIREFGGSKGTDDALAAIAAGAIDVLGGTAWVWASEKAIAAVDVLFIDEAGQMSLANAVAVAQAAHTLVLLGDPQQLQQPQRGAHPDGVDVSALDHILAGHKTMPADRGLFLPTTWRLAPAICDFTSEVFYEGRLEPRAGLERQRLAGARPTPFDGAGLFVVPVEHDGCRNASDEEAEVVADLVARLLDSRVLWVDAEGRERPLTPKDILVVAPYNAHVARIGERLAAAGETMAAVAVGTVDRFQGQEAPVVIYSMATSRPEDAPRGMEFLYSLNRLNVATSRARSTCILVLNPRLFEPECQTPRQMQLANALARAREMAERR